MIELYKIHQFIFNELLRFNHSSDKYGNILIPTDKKYLSEKLSITQNSLHEQLDNVKEQLCDLEIYFRKPLSGAPYFEVNESTFIPKLINNQHIDQLQLQQYITETIFENKQNIQIETDSLNRKIKELEDELYKKTSPQEYY